MNHPTTPTGPIKVLLVDERARTFEPDVVVLDVRSVSTILRKLELERRAEAAAYFAEHHDQRVSS